MVEGEEVENGGTNKYYSNLPMMISIFLIIIVSTSISKPFLLTSYWHVYCLWKPHQACPASLPNILPRKNRYEMKHVWPNHQIAIPMNLPMQQLYRISSAHGGLLLLPKSFNSSYGDLRYENKLPHYFRQNLLAKSLHPDCYSHHRALSVSIIPSGPTHL